MAIAHNCKQEQEILAMSRTIKALFTLLSLLLVTQGWILYASSNSTDKVHQIENTQAKLSNDMAWIKETLLDIKAEVKRGSK